jgi:hypothetical protein
MMSLLDELKAKLDEAKAALETERFYLVAHQSNMREHEAEIADLTRAIAALEPAPEADETPRSAAPGNVADASTSEDPGETTQSETADETPEPVATLPEEGERAPEEYQVSIADRPYGIPQNWKRRTPEVLIPAPEQPQGPSPVEDGAAAVRAAVGAFTAIVPIEIAALNWAASYEEGELAWNCQWLGDDGMRAITTIEIEKDGTVSQDSAVLRNGHFEGVEVAELLSYLSGADPAKPAPVNSDDASPVELQGEQPNPEPVGEDA